MSFIRKIFNNVLFAALFVLSTSAESLYVERIFSQASDYCKR